jgi:hypothetical protein
MRPLLLLLLSVLLLLQPAAAKGHPLESGVAITDPETLMKLEEAGLSLDALLAGRIRDRIARAHFGKDPSARSLFDVNALTPIRNYIKKQIEELPGQSLEPLVVAKSKPGDYRERFNPKFIDDRGSSLELTGVVNRMDRAFLSQHPCGEIRLIYRFVYSVKEPKQKERLKSRLPLTLSLVFDAWPGRRYSCTSIARRWLESGRQSLPPAEMAAWLRSEAGPLAPSLVDPRNILRIELNMQFIRLAAATKRDFGGHAEYLLKVFKWDQRKQIFQDGLLENQIDRAGLLRPENAAKLEKLRQWLLRPEVIYDLDRGRLVIPEEYLAFSAVSVAPGGLSRSQNNPFWGLLDHAAIDRALAGYVAAGNALKFVKSAQGFEARLNDLTCTGCHQTHGIAGFHFPGADRPGEPPSNAVFVPGSAHFFGDLPRRRAILEAFASRKRPDFARPFAGRTEEKFKEALAGTTLYDGWGAICYQGSDPTFAGWTCGEGLRCASLHASKFNPGFGTCIGTGRTKIGDPMEFGRVEMTGYGADIYCRMSPSVHEDCRINPDLDVLPRAPGDGKGYVVARQRYDNPKAMTGGFPAGMLRRSTCEDLAPEATCGRVAVTGFNKCILSGIDHKECTRNFMRPAGLRACDEAHPCREDYVCTARYAGQAGAKAGMGSCIPPYFVFQFRADGHPSSWVEQ